MTSYQMSEMSTQCMSCGCREGDKSIWTTGVSDSPDSQPIRCLNCENLKSGPLYISSKGIGWTSWKKRWFVLSRKSLMFYRADPNILTQKGSEATNPTLGGIELNNSGSVVAKQDKKLLTVLFPDGQDGRAFTLKTETLDELNEWKIALESALAQAPSASQVMGQNGIFCNEATDSVEGLVEQCMEKIYTTTSIVGRPVLLALEDIDGSPSFLEKAFSFIEEHGIKVEGILRQSADVEEVVRRVYEYEQGRDEFSSDEDAHVIGDCIKHLLREMPSPPVPASCCAALVDAYRTDRLSRVDNIHDAIYETFPEPNLRLLQRTLQMMLAVAAHKAENRMSLSALAACMAPLLLRPLLAGECELKNDFHMDGDGSFQLLQAAAAANHAQAIVIILLEEYEKIFDYDSSSSELYTESDDETDVDDDESADNNTPEEDGYHNAKNGIKADASSPDYSTSGSSSGSCSDVGSETDSELTGSELSSDVGIRTVSDVGSHTVSDVGSDTDTDTGNYTDSDDTGSNVGSVVKSDAGSGTGSNSSSDKGTKDNSTHSISVRDLDAVEITSTNSNNTPTYICEDIESKPAVSSHVQLQVDSPSFGTGVVQKNYDLPSEATSSNEILSQTSHDSSNSALSTTVTNKLVNIMPSAAQVTKFSELSKNVQPITRNKWGRTSARKNLSMESLDCISDDELEIDKLELQNNISKKLEGNAIQQAILDRRKVALHERHLALEKERDSPNYVVDNPLNSKDEAKSLTFFGDIQSFQKLLPRLSNHQGNAKSSGASSAPSEDPRSASKKAGKWDSSKKDAVASSDEQIALLRNNATRRHAPKCEDGGSSSSALTRLTNRLNFLKERRVQLANELHNLDPSRVVVTHMSSKTNSM